MTPRITVITLGVDNLERSLRLYRDGLSLKTEGIVAKPVHETFRGGYAGYFQNPDLHLREMAWNPKWTAD